MKKKLFVISIIVVIILLCSFPVMANEDCSTLTIFEGETYIFESIADGVQLHCTSNPYDPAVCNHVVQQRIYFANSVIDEKYFIYEGESKTITVKSGVLFVEYSKEIIPHKIEEEIFSVAVLGQGSSVYIRNDLNSWEQIYSKSFNSEYYLRYFNSENFLTNEFLMEGSDGWRPIYSNQRIEISANKGIVVIYMYLGNLGEERKKIQFIPKNNIDDSFCYNPFTLNKNEITLLKGQSTKIFVSGNIPGISVDEMDIKWKSLNDSIATIDSAGNIIGKNVGETDITATYKDYTIHCSVKVKNPNVDDFVYGDKLFFGDLFGYAKELKYWADALGYDLTYEECKKALSYQVDMPVLTEAGWCLDTGDTKTVKDVMKEILMQGELKQDLLALDKEVSQTVQVDPVTLNGFVKDYLKFYGEYADYVGDSNFSYDPQTTIHGLAAIDQVVRTVSGDSDSPIYQLSVLGNIVLQPTSAADPLRNVYKNEKESEMLELQDTAVAVLDSGNKLLQGTFSGGDVVDVSITTLNVLGKDSGAWYSGPLKVAAKANEVWGFLKLLDTGAIILVPAQMTGSYLNFCANFLTSYTEQDNNNYFLLCYYVSEKDQTFFENLKFNNDLSVGSGLGWTPPQTNSDDPIVDKLYSYMNSVGFTGFDGINCDQVDRRNMTSAAAILTDIKYVNYGEIQRNLLEYICAKQNPVKTFSFRVACPTAVDVLDSNGDVVFTVENGMENKNNINEYCSYYILGENKDIKYVNVQEGYSIRIRAVEDGTMDVQTSEYDGNSLVETNIYGDISISENDNYEMTTDNLREMEKVSDGNVVDTLNADETIVAVTSIDLGCESVTLEVDETITVNAVLSPQNCTNSEIEWMVDNAAIATVDATGKIKGVSEGQTYIAVSSADGNVTAYCEVVVTAKREEPTPIPTPTPTPTPTPEPEPEPIPTVNFTDVEKGEYYYDAVAWAVYKNITTGTSATTFSPENACTRGQAVTFLWRAAGKPAPKSSYNPFTDVKAGQYYYDAVLWAVENGITNGTSATTFSPDATCNRGQIVTFLYRAEGEPEVVVRSTFGDVKTDAYYAKAVTWAVNEKVTSGTSAITFSPDNDCTRGQIVTFLYRANK